MVEKIIRIGEISFPARSNAASFLSYKANFHRDALRDMLRLAKGFPADAKDDSAVMDALIANEDFDFDVFLRFLWVFAKAADKTIPPMEEWLVGMDVSPFDMMMEGFPQIQDMLLSNMRTDVRAKNSLAAARAK